MDVSFFDQMRRISNSLVSPGYIFTDAELKGDVEFSESVNAGEDLSVGSCVMSSIKFTLFDFNHLINEITGREFAWIQSVETGKESLKPILRASRGNLICVNGGAAYVVNNRPPYLSVWDADTLRWANDPQEQPSARPESLVVVGDILYCLHSESPYLEAYSIDGKNLTPIPAPTLNSFEEYKVKLFCQREYCWNLQGNELREYQMKLYDMKPVDLIETTFERLQRGLFTAEKPVKTNDALMTVTAYDRMHKFEQYADNWLLGVNFPISLGDMLQGLCQAMGVEAESYTFLNSDFMVQKNFLSQNVTGFQIIRWIAEAAAVFGRMNSSGVLHLGWYQPLNYTVTGHVYRTIKVEEFETKPIDKLQIRAVENDIGVIVPADDPTKTNLYVIENNPLLYAETDAELRPMAQKIFNAVKGISYRPYSVTMHQNPMVQAGSIITISTTKGVTFQGYVMSKSSKGGLDTLEATGSQERTIKADAQNQAIQQIRGSLHIFRNTINELNSEIIEYQKETDGTLTRHTTQIQQLSEQIVLKATKKEVEDAIAQAEASIKVTTDKITSEVSQKMDSGDFSTTLQQDSTSVQIAWNNIDKRVQFEEGELRIYDSSTNPAKLVSKFNHDGNHFYRDNYYVGHIGTDYLADDQSKKGLVFDLGYNAAYMGWGIATSQENEDEYSFNLRMMYQKENPLSDQYSEASKDLLYMTSDLYLGDNKLVNADLSQSFVNNGKKNINFSSYFDRGVTESRAIPLRQSGQYRELEFEGGALLSVYDYSD